MQGQRIGYIRVSTFDQNSESQLEKVDLDRTFTDKASGKSRARPQLEALLSYIREGDTLIVHSMGRLARNLDDLRALVYELTSKGIRVEFYREQLVFVGDDSPMAKLLLSVMGAFAELERSLILERQREGIALAKQRGAYKDRKQHSRLSKWKTCGDAQLRVRRKCNWPSFSGSAGQPCTNIWWCPKMYAVSNAPVVDIEKSDGKCLNVIEHLLGKTAGFTHRAAYSLAQTAVISLVTPNAFNRCFSCITVAKSRLPHS